MSKLHPSQIEIEILTDETYQIGPGGVAERDLVYLSGDNQVDKTDASDALQMPGIGFVVAVDSPSPGECEVRTSGVLGGFAGLPGNGTQMYADPATPGGITDVVPTGGDEVIQKVALSINASQIKVWPSPVIDVLPASGGWGLDFGGTWGT